MSYNDSSLKRIIDLILSSTILVSFSPLLTFWTILVKLDGTGGPVFSDAPSRVGKKGKVFHMYKFRTMIPDAHALIEDDSNYEDLKDKRIGGSLKVISREDRRLTWLGKIIRFWDFDELPQFINVLRGEMSVVGPRPCFVEELKMLENKDPKNAELIKTVLSVKPGITGKWQVSGRNNIDFQKKLEMESEYAETSNVFEDLLICIKTPFVILFRVGAK